MIYAKPEINILEDAARVIQFLGKPFPAAFETADGGYTFDPAYNLDE